MSSLYARCWANYRGDCARGMSHEHLISKSLFPEKMVRVSGFDWCQGGEKIVGVNSMQRKILCEKHNNDLSAVDMAAKEVIGAFATGASSVALNGLLLERWLVKTAVNLSLGGGLRIGCGFSESKPGWPSPYLLAVAFGDEVLVAKMGAYFLLPSSEYVYRADEIFMAPIQREDYIGGFIFGLRGQFIFLSLFPGHAPPPIHTLVPELLPEPLSHAALHYRPSSIVVQVDGNSPECIFVKW